MHLLAVRKLFIDGDKDTVAFRKNRRECDLTDDVRQIMLDYERLLAAADQDAWIPVSERLPELPCWGADAYLVAYRSERAEGIVTVPARFTHAGHFIWADAGALPINTEYREIVAWMPIPPYQPQGETDAT